MVLVRKHNNPMIRKNNNQNLGKDIFRVTVENKLVLSPKTSLF